jgi:hypothetical protein
MPLTLPPAPSFQVCYGRIRFIGPTLETGLLAKRLRSHLLPQVQAKEHDRRHLPGPDPRPQTPGQQARLRLVHLREDIFDVDKADRAVKVLHAKWKTRVARLLGPLKIVAEGEANIEVDNLAARSYDLAYETPAYLEGIGGNLLADRSDSGGFCAILED